jgi:hypothetical protein
MADDTLEARAIEDEMRRESIRSSTLAPQQEEVPAAPSPWWREHAIPLAALGLMLVLAALVLGLGSDLIDRRPSLAAEDRRAIDDALTALKTVRSFVSAGTNDMDYRPRVRDMKAVVDRSLARPWKEPGPLREALGLASVYHVAAAHAWSVSINHRDRPRNEYAKLLADVQIMTRLCRSKLRSYDSEIQELYKELYLKDVVSVLWDCASEQIDRATVELAQAR